MRSPHCVDRVGPQTDGQSVIVTCVHGTWARGSRWGDLEAAITDALGDCGSITFKYFEWSGRNSVAARAHAATSLRQQLIDQVARAPQARHVVVAHSHGANVVLHALNPDGTQNPNLNRTPNLNTNREERTEKCEPQLAGIVLLSPPLLDCEMVEQPAGAANKLLLAAVAVVPLLIAASRYARETLDISRALQSAGVLSLITIWLTAFWPAVVKRRADALARQVALPRVDFPGLVVRAADDEATLALGWVSAFARGTRQLWSRILNTHAAFWRRDEQRLRNARTLPEIASAVFDTVILVPMSVALLWFAHSAATDERWAPLAVSLPFALVLGTGALVIVGGSVLMLLTLPAFSFLLWPFGIVPTPASALLNVSVAQAPTPSWRVVSIEKGETVRRRSGQSGLKHSLHEQPEALRCVANYLRDSLRTPNLEPRTPNIEPSTEPEHEPGTWNCEG